jgi:hypothetical protein
VCSISRKEEIFLTLGLMLWRDVVDVLCNISVLHDFTCHRSFFFNKYILCYYNFYVFAFKRLIFYR